MKVYVLDEHWETTAVFVTKEIAYKELEKRRRECHSCQDWGEREKDHSINVVEAK